jgi:hypothetical protein
LRPRTAEEVVAVKFEDKDGSEGLGDKVKREEECNEIWAGRLRRTTRTKEEKKNLKPTQGLARSTRKMQRYDLLSRSSSRPGKRTAQRLPVRNFPLMLDLSHDGLNNDGLGCSIAQINDTDTDFSDHLANRSFGSSGKAREEDDDDNFRDDEHSDLQIIIHVLHRQLAVVTTKQSNTICRSMGIRERGLGNLGPH